MELTYEEWFEKYKPITNERDEIRIYETYGPDLDYIQSIAETNRVWTWVDGGDYSVITNGIRFVNRLCYYVTDFPWKDEDDIEINMYEPEECDITGEHMWVDYVRAIDNKTIKVCDFCEMSKEEYDEYND